MTAVEYNSKQKRVHSKLLLSRKSSSKLGFCSLTRSFHLSVCNCCCHNQHQRENKQRNSCFAKQGVERSALRFLQI